MTEPESVIANVGLSLAAFETGPLSVAARRTLAELVRHQKFVAEAMAVGIDKADAERLLVEWPDDDAEFLLKAHIMGVTRDAALRILWELPRRMADQALEWAAIDEYRNIGLDIAITTERDRREAIASGRHREGGPHDWYARITWSRKAWDAIHPPKRAR